MKYLGNVEDEELYAKWDGNQIKFILGNSEIAVFDPDVMEDPILFMENTKANELSAEAKDTITRFAENVTPEELQEMDKKYGREKQQEIADTLGIERRKIASITEIDMDEKAEKKPETGKEKEEKSKDKKEKEKEKVQTTKDVKVKQELKMSTMATDMKTIGQVLQRAGKMPKMDGKNFETLGIVESTDVKNAKGKTNTTRFSFVAIATDGTIAPIDLKQDYQEGDNPREINYQVRTDGSVEQDDVLSRFTVGNSGETLSIKQSNGPGYIEVAYSQNKTLGGEGISGNVSLDRQLATRNTICYQTRKEMRQTEYEGYRSAEEGMRELSREGEEDVPNLKQDDKGIAKDANYKEADGDEQTKSHQHLDIEDIERIAEKIMKEDGEIEETFTKKEVIERLRRAEKNGENLENVRQDLKEDARNLPSRDM